MKRLFAITALTTTIPCGSAIAEGMAQRGNRDGALELTMTLMPKSATTSAAVTAIIELPKESIGDAISSTRGVERSARGLDTANSARQDGSLFGEAAAAAARDNREAAGRALHPGENRRPAAPEPSDRPSLPPR